MCPHCTMSLSGPITTKSIHMMLVRQKDCACPRLTRGLRTVYRPQLIVKVISRGKEDGHGETR